MSTTIVSYGRKPERCEIICKKDTVTLYRQGKLDKSKVLVTDTIYKDAQKGDVVPQQLLVSVFGEGVSNTDAVEKILTEGEYSISTNELRALRDAAYRGVVAYIKRNYINPVGDREYTESSIESALESVKVRGSIDHNQSAEANFNKIKKKLQGKFPLKPKPGCIPYSVELTWTQHSKYYNQFKSYIQSETQTNTGYTMELLVPPKDMDRIARLLS